MMDALGAVYHHARGVLDRINPDRWSNKQQGNAQGAMVTGPSPITLVTGSVWKRHVINDARFKSTFGQKRFIKSF